MTEPTDKPGFLKRLPIHSIFFKLSALVAVTAVLLCAVLAYHYTTFTIAELERVEAAADGETTTRLASQLANPIRFEGIGAIATAIAELTDRDGASAQYGLAVNADGEKVAAHGPDPAQEGRMLEIARQALETGALATSDDGLIIAAPATIGEDGSVVGAVAVDWSLEHIRASVMAKQSRAIALAIASFGIGIAVLIWFMNRLIIAPVKRLTSAVSAVADGDYSVEVQGTTRRDEIGSISRAIEGFRNNLAKGAEQARENEFRGVAFEASAAAIMMADKDFVITAINPALRSVFSAHEEALAVTIPDFRTDEIVGKPMDTFHSPALRARIGKVLQDPANLPLKADLAMGEVRFHIIVNMVPDHDGSCMGYVIEWIDQTQSFIHQAVIKAIDDNQVRAEFDLSGDFITSNPSFAAMMGETCENLKNRPSSEIFKFDPALAEERGAVFDRLAQGESVQGRFELVNASGQPAFVDGVFSPVVDGKGEVLHFILIGNDVTEARRAIEEAEAHRAAMEKAQTNVVESLRMALEKLSQGELTTQLEKEFAPEYEQLRQDFNKAMTRLRDAMQGVVENAELIQGEAREISNASDDLASRTEHQAATLEETAAALDELTSSVSSAADGASLASELVQTARKDAEASGEVVREAVGAMGEIETSSQQISKITGVIDDIAFQTNLLALNAGVEAARAGEAGRGFAVVASEVRALAQRSSEAAREINALIADSGGHVKRGVDLVDQAGAALAGIVASVKEISQKVGEIAVSSREQSSGLAEINSAVNQLDQVTQQNAAMFEQTTAASHALNSEAEALNQTMARFEIGIREIDEPKPENEASSVEQFVSSRASRAKTPNRSLSGTAGTAALSRAVEDEIDDDWDDF